MFWMSIAAIGYILLLAVDARNYPGVCYAAVFLSVTGVAPCISGTITWCKSGRFPSLAPFLDRFSVLLADSGLYNRWKQHRTYPQTCYRHGESLAASTNRPFRS